MDKKEQRERKGGTTQIPVFQAVGDSALYVLRYSHYFFLDTDTYSIAVTRGLLRQVIKLIPLLAKFKS
jgi:hypothetical protein